MKTNSPLIAFLLLTLALPIALPAQQQTSTIDLDAVPVTPLRHMHTIDDAGEPVFSNWFFSTIAYDKNKQWLFVGDEDQIVVFNRDGNKLHVIGRRGQGPGEYALISRIIIDQSLAYIADIKNYRVTILDEAHSYLRTIPMKSGVLDLAMAGTRGLLVYKQSIRGNLLHLYDPETASTPQLSFLEAITEFPGIQGNALTINTLRIAATQDHAFIFYMHLPMMKIYHFASRKISEIHFAGRAVENLYEPLPGQVRTSSGAAPLKIFIRRAVVGPDGDVYWASFTKAHRKIFRMDSRSQQITRAYSFVDPAHQAFESTPPGDFCLMEQNVAVLDFETGSIEIYRPVE